MAKADIKGSVTVGTPLNKPAVPIIYTAPNGDKLTALFSGNDIISITQELPRFVTNWPARIKGFFKIRKKEHPKVYKGLVDVGCIQEDPDGVLVWIEKVVAKRKGG
ncbi:unnamed protein product [marine sediment metagenome]|uniref:Uncharacterized protein n=1 Tax=marine sediment metagenome TaxID=412755 RepID=X1DMK0_9ZZZZ